MLKKIVFDFDGTLADSFKQIVGIICEIRPEVREEDIDVYRNEGARSFQKRAKISMVDLVKLVSAFKTKQAKIIEEADDFPGIRELLIELKEKGIEVGILSSNHKESIERWLGKKRITVDWVVSESNIFGKDKSINKIKSEGMFYVGDEVRDVDACKRAKVQMVAVAWGFNTKEALHRAGADYVVGDVTELRNLLLSFNQ